MKRLSLTLQSPAENLALDEALLEWAEEGRSGLEVLRLWEPATPMVVVGRSSRVALEVNEEACRAQRVPVLRRSSGGAAIVTGPGCLMYTVVLSYAARPDLRDITRAHQFILGRLESSLRQLLANEGSVSLAGTSDLAFCGLSASSTPRKFSGNSLRVKRNHLLYHGTLLYDFDLTLVEKLLLMPPRQPDYRGARRHSDFVMNLPASREQLIDAVNVAWPTDGELTGVPMSRVKNLVSTRFANNDWNYEFA
jgi:lipoate-protein ligase A